MGTVRLLAQPELMEGQTARKSDTKEIKDKRSSRLVGGAETGSRGREDSCCCGGTQTGGVWDKQGRQSGHWQAPWPHIHAQINRMRGGLPAQGSGMGK